MNNGEQNKMNNDKIGQLDFTEKGSFLDFQISQLMFIHYVIKNNRESFNYIDRKEQDGLLVTIEAAIESKKHDLLMESWEKDEAKLEEKRKKKEEKEQIIKDFRKKLELRRTTKEFSL